MFEVLRLVKALDSVDKNTRNVTDLVRETALVRAKFLHFHDGLQQNISRFRLFVQMLKAVTTGRQNMDENERCFAVFAFFYMVSEKFPEGLLSAFSRNFLGVEFAQFYSVLDADLLRLNSKNNSRLSVDFVFNWLLENNTEDAGVPIGIIGPIFEEKLGRMPTLEAIQDYTDSCRVVDQELIFKGLRRLMVSNDRENDLKVQSNAVSLAIREFVKHYKRDEYITAFERTLKLGISSLSSAMCVRQALPTCPCCNSTIQKVL